MSLTPFDGYLGTVQGQVSPSGVAAPSGDFAFVLGADPSGTFWPLNIGDHITVSQSGDVQDSGSDLVRFTAIIRPPSAMPDGAYWEFAFRVDGANIKTQRIDPGRTRTRVDMAANVANLAAIDHEISFRLELKGAGGPHYVELPGVYVDQVVLVDTSERPTLINRDGEADETATPVNATLTLDVTDVGAASIDLATTKIYIDGTLAFDAGTFQVGYTGPESAHSNPQADTLRIAIDPSGLLPDNSVVIVRVVSAITGLPLLSLDQSYSLNTEDLTNPTLSLATAREMKIVRATFNEGMLSESASADGDATNPASWAISLVTGSEQTRLPAVETTVASVEKVAEDVFDLTTAIELTPGASYDLTGSSVRDASGNPTLSPNNVARFVAFRPTESNERDWVLLEQLPDLNVSEDLSEDLEKFVGVTQELADLKLFAIDAFGDILDPDLAPIEFVDAMLSDLGNPFDFDLSDDDKRRLVKLLVPIYRQKGTNPGIINAIRFFLGIEVTITEPATSGGHIGADTLGGTMVLSTSELATLLTFCIESPVALTDEQRDQITKIADYMKRGECHFKITEPSVPIVTDHWSLGLSRLGSNTILH